MTIMMIDVGIKAKATFARHGRGVKNKYGNVLF